MQSAVTQQTRRHRTKSSFARTGQTKTGVLCRPHAVVGAGEQSLVLAAVARLAAHAASFQLATLNQTLRFAMRWMNKSYLFLLRLLSGLKCPPRVVASAAARAALAVALTAHAVGNGSGCGGVAV
jgi:hypothetical protein